MAADQLKDYLLNGNIKNSVNLPNVAQEWSGISRVCLIHQNIPAMLTKITSIPVSYTHLDVYKRQARAYSDSEEKVGAAFAGMRDRVILATKTAAQTADGFWKDLESSLRALGTDHIDVYQFHNPAFCPRPGGADGLYDAALEAKRQGKIRHISITNHRLAVAHEAIGSGLYDTLQFPFSYLSGAQELELVEKCREMCIRDRTDSTASRMARQ